MNMKKTSALWRTISFLSAFCLILATTVMPVAASSQTPSIQSDQNEDFIAEIERFLAESVFAFPDSYHISQFSSFSLGKAIPSFVWDDGDNCVVESTAKVYPLVKDGVVLGLLHTYSLGQNKYAFSYSEGQVDAINQAHDNIAFYSNGVNVRILHESELTPLEESIFHIQGCDGCREEDLFSLCADRHYFSRGCC